MSQAIDLLTVYQFLKRLVTPFKQWEAYKRGIIDEEGNVLRKRKTLGKQEERDAWGYLDIITANLKKLLGRLPGGKSAIATYAAAFLLLRESIDETLIDRLESDEDLFEEIAANVVGTGAIAGAVPGEDPPVFRNKKRRKDLVAAIIKREPPK